MNGNMHLFFGAYVGATGAVLLNTTPEESLFFISAAMVGSLFPDIDEPGSMLGKHIPVLPKFFKKNFGHRGLIHTPIFMLALWTILYGVTYPYGFSKVSFGFLLGYSAHLVQDMFTKRGISLLYPFYKKKISLGFFKSGSYADFLITLLLCFFWQGAFAFF